MYVCMYVNKSVFGIDDLSHRKGQPEVLGTPNWLIDTLISYTIKATFATLK